MEEAVNWKVPQATENLNTTLFVPLHAFVITVISYMHFYSISSIITATYNMIGSSAARP